MILHAWVFIVRPEEKNLDKKLINGLDEKEAALVDIVVYLTWMGIILGILMQIYIEMKQIIFHKLAYFQDFWNLVDFFSIGAVLFCLFCSVFMTNWYEISATFMFLLLYTKFFYFLRIFESTASIVKSVI